MTGPRKRERAAVLVAIAVVASATGCKKGEAAEKASASGAPPQGSAGETAPVSSLVVDHGELDTPAPDSAPKLAATVIATTVYKLPNVDSRKLGYLRLGGIVKRDPDPVPGKGCKADWYRIYPMGHVCTDEATIDLEHALVRAASKRPDLRKPLPYRYGFVRATAPQYLRVPTRAEQLKSEFKLEEHLQWFEENKAEVQRVELGANDVPLDTRGIPRRGLRPPAGYRPSTELSLNELFGAAAANEPIPWWLEGGRKIVNVSAFVVPDYAIFADRVRRKTGLSFVSAFEAEDGGFRRRFAVTVDLRLIPTTKVKPDTGSPFHGVEITAEFPVPFSWVIKRDVMSYKLIKGKDEARRAEAVPRRAIVPLSGTARIKAGKRFYQTLKNKTRWLAADDIAVVATPKQWPDPAQKGEKWIDISLRQQTFVLYEGKRPWYATLVSTGRDRLGDPKESLATPQGSFRLKSKHIAAAMDSEENSSVAGGVRANTAYTSASAGDVAERLKRAEAEGEKLSDEDQRRLVNIKKGRHPE